jgi:hypothetical protein
MYPTNKLNKVGNNHSTPNEKVSVNEYVLGDREACSKMNRHIQPLLVEIVACPIPAVKQVDTDAQLSHSLVVVWSSPDVAGSDCCLIDLQS